MCGYGFAWIGHFVFEKNKPASFKRPLYSLMGDWVMYRDIWSGKIRLLSAPHHTRPHDAAMHRSEAPALPGRSATELSAHTQPP